MSRSKPVDWLAASVGLRVRAARRAKGLTTIELGELMGVSTQAVSNWERGLSAMCQASLVGLSAATDKPLHWFYLPVDRCSACGQPLPIEPEEGIDGGERCRQ